MAGEKKFDALVRSVKPMDKRAGRKSSSGFTLVELMITLVLMAILLGIGVPGFRSFILDQRLRATSTDIRLALSTTRSEAVKRNRDVELKPSAGGWSEGWTIPSPVVDDPPLLNHVQSGNLTITNDLSEVVFTASGRVLAAADFEIDVGYSKVGCLSLQLDGRAVYAEGACP